MTNCSKTELHEKLDESFTDVIIWIENHSEDHINAILIPDKWTAAQHVFHLVKTTKAVSKGMKMPKLGLRGMFGLNNREEKSYDEIAEKYQKNLIANNVKAPPEFCSEPGRNFTKEEITSRFSDELKDLKKALNKWKEEDLSKYILPHPVIGKLSIREFICWVAYHNYHHLNILKEQYKIES